MGRVFGRGKGVLRFRPLPPLASSERRNPRLFHTGVRPRLGKHPRGAAIYIGRRAQALFFGLPPPGKKKKQEWAGRSGRERGKKKKSPRAGKFEGEKLPKGGGRGMAVGALLILIKKS